MVSERAQPSSREKLQSLRSEGMERIDLKAATKSTLLTMALALALEFALKHNQRRRGIFVDGGVWREKVDK